MKYFAFAVGVLFLASSACAAGSDDGPAGGSGGSGGSGAGDTGGNGGQAAGAGNQGGDGGGFIAEGGGGGGYVPEPEVFGHSATVLYKLDPLTKDVGIVGNFSGPCGDIVDLALDAESNIFATTNDGLYSVDKITAACTLIAEGDYPNSLSFVPKGTLEADEEVLVGFLGDQYIRIDQTTGNVTNVGNPWNTGFISSGDVVSVKNGPTFLTIKGTNNQTDEVCADCLVEINPTTGKITKEYHDIGYEKVFGAAFWAGSIYGFTNGGELFEIVIENNQLSTSLIATPSDLVFWGAGSSTLAPPVAQ